MQARGVLTQLQAHKEVREAAPRWAPGQPRAQSGVLHHPATREVWCKPRHEGAGCTAQLPALRWMEGRERAPTYRDPTVLPGGAKLGMFWHNCKREEVREAALRPAAGPSRAQSGLPPEETLRPRSDGSRHGGQT